MPEENATSLRSRIFHLLFFVAVVVDAAAIVVFIAIFESSKWHPQLLRFTYRVWLSFLSDQGSSGRGFVSGLLIAVFTIVFTIAGVGLLQGRAAMKKHVWETAGIGFVVLVTLILIVYGSQFAWEVAHVADRDHSDLIARNRELQSQQINNPYQKSFIGSYAYINTLVAFGYLVRDPRRQADQHSECQVKITTDPENKDVAMALGGDAGAMGCYVLQEPYDPDADSESWSEIKQSLPNFVVIHALRDNMRAQGFFVGMSNSFHVQRAYNLPPNSPPNLVWIQIGKGSIWRRDK